MRTYQITDEAWNPSGIEHCTEDDIMALVEAFGLDKSLVTIGDNVIYDGEIIGRAD